ncbi:Uncharacterised protein [Mycobacteroides abscessus subsp. abscessus]|nr:Uncharacterised protein [Mycobacteroides abscessus subsp. abscessus]
MVFGNWSIAVLKLGFLSRKATIDGSFSADFRTGMYPTFCEKYAVLSVSVMKLMNLSALTFRASEIRAGIARPAPPVGQPTVPSGAGRNAVPKLNLAFLVIPDRSPVDATVEAMMPALKSPAMSLDIFA